MAIWAVFTLSLHAGPAHLETELRTADGANLGAYYVYVETTDVASVASPN